MNMMAAKEAIAEEEDDDVPGKQPVFEISERISCCIVVKWFISPRSKDDCDRKGLTYWLTLSSNIDATWITCNACFTELSTDVVCCFLSQTLWRTLMKPPRMKQTDSSFLREQLFFSEPHYGLTKGISSCGEMVVNSAMHHLW